jgi:hypothetical protein
VAEDVVVADGNRQQDDGARKQDGGNDRIEDGAGGGDAGGGHVFFLSGVRPGTRLRSRACGGVYQGERTSRDGEAFTSKTGVRGSAGATRTA